MPRFVAFLRGINLGKRRLPMSRLKASFEELGFTQVETFIASGNVLFSSKTGDPGKLEARIARHLESSLGFPVDTFVRTPAEVVAMGRAEIVPPAAREVMNINVGLLQQQLPSDVALKLAAVRTGYDEFLVTGREYYWLCRGRTSDSKVWSLPQMKALRLPTSTMRNLTSIRKLIAKHLA